MKDIKKFTIFRSQWLHSEGEDASMLHRPKDNKRCCLGIYLEACGFSTEYLSEKLSPYCILNDRRHSEWGEIPKWLSRLSIYNGNGDLENSFDTVKLMEINDSTFENDELDGSYETFLSKKETQITSIFESNGIAVHFED